MNGNSTSLKIELPSLSTGIHPNFPEDQYHALPYVSSSFLKKFKSNPAAALLPVNQTDAMVLGSASHAYSLEGEKAFFEKFIVAPKLDKRTKDGKAQWELIQQQAATKTVLSQDQFDVVLGLDKSLKSHPMAKTLLRTGNEEMTIIWDDEETGLRCKARIDFSPGKNCLVDYKTCASVDKFTSQIVNLNYDIQAAHYTEGAQAAEIGNDAFLFVAAETSEPYPVRCGFIHPDWLSWAKDERRRLMNLVKECKESGVYPNYQIPEHICSLSQITPVDLLEEWEMPKWRK